MRDARRATRDVRRLFGAVRAQLLKKICELLMTRC
jgi:hypothetical protein